MLSERHAEEVEALSRASGAMNGGFHERGLVPDPVEYS